MSTLGLSTNTRLLGLAIINQSGLEDYSIHLHKSSWSPAKATKIITSLEPCVRQYCIKRVVLSIPHESHQTEAFKLLIVRIREYFETRQIPVFTETQKSLYTLYAPGKKKTKKDLMQTLTLQYPQLTYCFQKEMRNKSKYYIKVFEQWRWRAFMNAGNEGGKQDLSCFLFYAVVAAGAHFSLL